MIQTLQEFISVAEREGFVLRVKETVFLEDLPEIIHRLLKKDKVLLFENLDSYPCQVISNLVPSHAIFKLLMGANDPYTVFLNRITQKGRWTIIPRHAEYSYVDVRGKDIREHLPLLHHYEQDTAPFITTGIISAMDPDTGVVARGIHRMGWRGNNRFGIALLNPPLKDVYPKYAKRGKDMPVSIVIGVDPLLFLSMALKVPPDTDKLELTSAIKGLEIPAMRSPQNNIPIPFGPEYVLEGYVSFKEAEPDGTLGEISGYPLTFGETPTLHVEALYHKERPIYHALLPTSPEADSYLTFVSRAHLGADIKRLFPFVEDIFLVKKTFGASAIISVRETEKELIRNLILFCLSFPMIKKVVIVDNDVDISDMAEIEWAVITRCKIDSDVIIVPGLKGQPIDPTAQKDVGVTKIGINATKKSKDIPERVVIKKGKKERVERILKMGGEINE